MWPERHSLRLVGPDLRLLRLDLRPERPDLRPDRLDLRPSRPDLRPDRLVGGTDKQTNKRTNESPPVFYRTSSLSGPLPKNAPFHTPFLIMSKRGKRILEP